MRPLASHWPRIALTLLPLAVALLHATGVLRLGALDRLDALAYDARLRATLSAPADDRIAIVDLDERSLAEVGPWPWPRDRVARLARELFEVQQVDLVGFTLVFAEADDSSGLARLRELARGPLRGDAAFQRQLAALEPALDHDAALARTLQGRPVVLGYVLRADGGAPPSGALPAPVLPRERLEGVPLGLEPWAAFGGNLPALAQAAPAAGFLHMHPDGDGVLRALPLLAEYQDQVYESLALAMLRALLGGPSVEPVFAAAAGAPRLDHLRLQAGDRTVRLRVTHGARALVPFRGRAGPQASRFRYVSAADLLAGRLAPGTLEGRVVLVGTTAAGLQGLHATPVGAGVADVEIQAHLLAGLLDGQLPARPAWAAGYDVAVLLLAGLALALALPLLTPARALLATALVAALVTALNLQLFRAGHVLPLAAAVLLALAAFALNMGWGYFVESRGKRKLARLFGHYVPPELVDEMLEDPDRYGMAASIRELTVMFCDMRGFTRLAQQMPPAAVQALLHDVFSRLTARIRARRGTIDKYMGDCVMAFWGAPVATPQHAALATQAALDIVAEVRAIDAEHRARGLPPLGVGIGLNTGTMCVGDMGSDVRRAYTVIGDAVNLGARLQPLARVYGVEIVAGDAVRAGAPGFAWQELDRVRVRGRAQAEAIHTPLAQGAAPELAQELAAWEDFLRAYRRQDWARAGGLLRELRLAHPQKSLYALYAERVASMRQLPYDPAWDGATTFDTK